MKSYSTVVVPFGLRKVASKLKSSVRPHVWDVKLKEKFNAARAAEEKKRDDAVGKGQEIRLFRFKPRLSLA